ERADLVDVRGLDLIERDDAEPGVVRIGRIRQRDRHRSDRAGDEATPTVALSQPLDLRPTLPRRLLVDLPREVVEERVLDDLLIEVRILAPTVLARVFDEE